MPSASPPPCLGCGSIAKSLSLQNSLVVYLYMQALCDQSLARGAISDQNSVCYESGLPFSLFLSSFWHPFRPQSLPEGARRHPTAPPKIQMEKGHQKSVRLSLPCWDSGPILGTLGVIIQHWWFKFGFKNAPLIQP